MTVVVISQPMYFPWVGLFEQIACADVFIHLDDAQYSKGAFTNRVQIKLTANAKNKWLSVPIDRQAIGTPIAEVPLDESKPWRQAHRDRLAQVYASARYLGDMLALVDKVFAQTAESIADLDIAAIEAVCEYFDLGRGRRFIRSSTMGVPGRSSRRVADLVCAAEGDRYVTGHGAASYLDHEMLESRGIETHYIDYLRRPYPQLHGEFDPHVSILDLIANTGTAGRDIICSPTVAWRQFIERSST
ncbi:MAG: WbqC family protein [Phycisphaeraceae bacterium]|nr:WbqC family protein [Phycisphaeraceae bacterium]